MLDFTKSLGGAMSLCAVLLLVAGGCGVSQYDSLANRRLALLRGEAKFRHLYAPMAIPDTPMSIRLPMVFRDSYTEKSGHRDDGAAIHPDRLQPPFLKLPGFKLCYEGTNTSGDTTLPFYCYVAALPAQPGDADRIAAQMQAQLKKSFPDAPDEWQPVDAQAPTSLYIHWRKIHVEGEQEFRVKIGDKVETQKLPGKFELWIHDADDYVVLIAWRTPTSIEGASPAVGDTNQLEALFQGPPADAKLDLGDMPEATAGTLEREGAE